MVAHRRAEFAETIDGDERTGDFRGACNSVEVEHVVSQRKLNANRQNAKLSTGPRNTRVTRYNALKHGLLAKAALIRNGEAAENPRELRALIERLREDWNPVGAMEDLLVEHIAVSFWRLCRAQKAEVGEIRRRSDHVSLDMTIAAAENITRSLDFARSLHTGTERGCRSEMLKASGGIQHLLSVLEEARAVIEDEGYLDTNQSKKVAELYGNREGTVGGWLIDLSFIAADGLKAADEERRFSLTPEACKGTMLKLIDDELDGLQFAAEVAAECETLDREAAGLSNHLPRAEALEKIIRYETAIERQMYRAIDELKTLQTARLGGGTVRRRLMIGVEEES